MTTERDNQHERQLHALIERLTPLRSQVDGTLADVRSPFHRIRIIKQADQIHFYFVNADATLDGPMSRIDLTRPLHLIAGYTQCALLSLLWKPESQHVCMLGLAGGRISLVLYHAFPMLAIDNVELDPLVGPIAEHYFGLTLDARQRLITSDARDYLLHTEKRYDIIVMDAFRDASDNLDHLATTGFYELARKHLTQGGVLAANMLASDPHYNAKLAAFTATFNVCYQVQLKHSTVVFGGDLARLNPQTILHRAALLQRSHVFDFPLEERAAALQPLRGADLRGAGSTALRD